MFQYILCVGSSKALGSSANFDYRFQYILCVGSSFTPNWDEREDDKFQYILCVGSRDSVLQAGFEIVVSIHPMCRFKHKVLLIDLDAYRFQYILCVGSSL